MDNLLPEDCLLDRKCGEKISGVGNGFKSVLTAKYVKIETVPYL